MTTIEEAIASYLATGRCEHDYALWPGGLIERGRRAQADLRDALVAAVRRAAGARNPRASLDDLDVVELTRKKVAPMVRGFFSPAEQDIVLAILERSTVFLTPENIEKTLRDCTWDRTAWDLANLYLGSLGVEPLAEDAPRLVGLSESTKFYVSLDYFREDDPFADFVVHEAAHVFHNCKRRTIGLPERRRREWLLEIEYRKRETFAYACEAYARIVERAARPRDRSAIAAEYARDGHVPGDERVDRSELVDIVEDAARSRNGWKRILARCAPAPLPTRAERMAFERARLASLDEPEPGA